MYGEGDWIEWRTADGEPGANRSERREQRKLAEVLPADPTDRREKKRGRGHREGGVARPGDGIGKDT